MQVLFVVAQTPVPCITVDTGKSINRPEHANVGRATLY
jgi:hypothetical protein